MSVAGFGSARMHLKTQPDECTWERVSIDMMAFPPCPTGVVPKTPEHVDSLIATCFSFSTPYVSSKYANVCPTCAIFPIGVKTV